VIELAENEEKANCLGLAASERVKAHFTWKIIGPKWEKLFEQLSHKK
jgi:glycosyltransferase involved in cell wall biosynthesis